MSKVPEFKTAFDMLTDFIKSLDNKCTFGVDCKKNNCDIKILNFIKDLNLQFTNYDINYNFKCENNEYGNYHFNSSIARVFCFNYPKSFYYILTNYKIDLFHKSDDTLYVSLSRSRYLYTTKNIQYISENYNLTKNDYKKLYCDANLSKIYNSSNNNIELDKCRIFISNKFLEFDL